MGRQEESWCYTEAQRSAASLGERYEEPNQLLLLSASRQHGSCSGAECKASFFDPAMNKLLKVKWISNHNPGFGGNEFYKLSKELLKSHDPADFKRMANHRNPILRAMGLLCLAQTDKDEYLQLLLSHWKDGEGVYLNQGCISSQITVGEFVQRIFVNPYFLDP